MRPRVPIRIGNLQLRNLITRLAEQARSSDGIRSFAALNISTLAFAAWTLWLYVSYGRAHQQLTLQQLDLAVQQARAAAAIDATQAKLAIENAGLENQLRHGEINYASGLRVKLTQELDVYRVDAQEQLYEADFQVRVEDISRVKVEVSWVVFEWYLGTLAKVRKWRVYFRLMLRQNLSAQSKSLAQ